MLIENSGRLFRSIRRNEVRSTLCKLKDHRMQPQEFIRRLCQSTVGDQLIKNIRKNFGREFKINDCNSFNLQMDPSGE